MCNAASLITLIFTQAFRSADRALYNALLNSEIKCNDGDVGPTGRQRHSEYSGSKTLRLLKLLGMFSLPHALRLSC